MLFKQGMFFGFSQIGCDQVRAVLAGNAGYEGGLLVCHGVLRCARNDSPFSVIARSTSDVAIHGLQLAHDGTALRCRFQVRVLVDGVFFGH